MFGSGRSKKGTARNDRTTMISEREVQQYLSDHLVSLLHPAATQTETNSQQNISSPPRDSAVEMGIALGAHINTKQQSTSLSNGANSGTIKCENAKECASQSNACSNPFAARSASHDSGRDCSGGRGSSGGGGGGGNSSGHSKSVGGGGYGSLGHW